MDSFDNQTMLYEIDKIFGELNVLFNCPTILKYSNLSTIINRIIIEGFNLPTLLFAAKGPKIMDYINTLLEHKIKLNFKDKNCNNVASSCCIYDCNNYDKFKIIFEQKIPLQFDDFGGPVKYLVKKRCDVYILDFILVKHKFMDCYLDNDDCDEYITETFVELYLYYKDDKSVQYILEYLCETYRSNINFGPTILGLLQDNDMSLINVLCGCNIVDENKCIDYKKIRKFIKRKDLAEFVDKRKFDASYELYRILLVLCKQYDADLRIVILDNLYKFSTYKTEIFMLFVKTIDGDTDEEESEEDSEEEYCNYKRTNDIYVYKILAKFIMDFPEYIKELPNLIKDVSIITNNPNIKKKVIIDGDQQYINILKLCDKKFNVDEYVKQHILSMSLNLRTKYMFNNSLHNDYIYKHILGIELDDIKMGHILAAGNFDIQKFVYDYAMSGKQKSGHYYKTTLENYIFYKFIFAFCGTILYPIERSYSCYKLRTIVKTLLLIFKTGLVNKGMQYVTKKCIFPYVYNFIRKKY